MPPGYGWIRSMEEWKTPAIRRNDASAACRGNRILLDRQVWPGSLMLISSDVG